MKAKVLFICVENSCRSQIAEGFARQLGTGVLEPTSAGSKPSGKINPMAIEVMKELGVDLSRQASKGLSDVSSDAWDFVITMGCGDACPFVPSRARRDWAIADPKHLPLDEFREVRDQIGQKVKGLIDEVKSS